MTAKTFDFPVSPLFFWIKGHIEVDNKVTKVETRNTVLGIIPAGANKQTVPMSNVSSVSVRTGVLLKPILIGIILTVIGVLIIPDVSEDGAGVLFLGLILIILGVSDVIAGIPTYLDIETGGTIRTIFAPIYAKSTVQAAADAMNSALLNTEDRRDASAAADKVVDAIKSTKEQ